MNDWLKTPKTGKNLKTAPNWSIMLAILLGTTWIFLSTVLTAAAQGYEKAELSDQSGYSTARDAAHQALVIAATPTQTPDKYYSSYFAHSWDIPEEAAQGNTFWVEVNLSTQTLSAYRGDQIINTFLVSTGTSAFPTVTGTYQIYAKYSQYTMRGPDYDLPDVPYTMFFYKGYSLHGTYWHNNFGTPMSRGCVNMKTEDAAWIYEQAPVGTYVFIHY